ncbi:hypothetical protein [Falsiroseomonas sp. E2-1-a20]|uniref:hypothetical protein n=1 Tax=Falsiroseomonas sp. E2-1-a20 TaxID=3239300 RepID=UPI003F343CC0
MINEAIPKATATLIPMLKSHVGFEGYIALPTEQGDICVCSMYSDASAATRSYEQVRSWVMENMSHLPTPDVFPGTVGAHVSVEAQGIGRKLYCMIRRTENVPSPRDRPLGEGVLGSAMDMPGFMGAYILRSTDDPKKGASIWFCDTREHAMAVHETTMQYLKEHNSEVTTRLVASGEAVVLELA